MKKQWENFWVSFLFCIVCLLLGNAFALILLPSVRPQSPCPSLVVSLCMFLNKRSVSAEKYDLWPIFQRSCLSCHPLKKRWWMLIFSVLWLRGTGDPDCHQHRDRCVSIFLAGSIQPLKQVTGFCPSLARKVAKSSFWFAFSNGKVNVIMNPSLKENHLLLQVEVTVPPSMFLYVKRGLRKSAVACHRSAKISDIWHSSHITQLATTHLRSLLFQTGSYFPILWRGNLPACLTDRPLLSLRLLDTCQQFFKRPSSWWKSCASKGMINIFLFLDSLHNDFCKK